MRSPPTTVRYSVLSGVHNPYQKATKQPTFGQVAPSELRTTATSITNEGPFTHVDFTAVAVSCENKTSILLQDPLCNALSYQSPSLDLPLGRKTRRAGQATNLQRACLTAYLARASSVMENGSGPSSLSLSFLWVPRFSGCNAQNLKLCFRRRGKRRRERLLFVSFRRSCLPLPLVLNRA